MKKYLHTLLVVSTAFFSFSLPLPVQAHDGHKHAESTKPYKADTCIVSGDKLGEMGKPVVFEYKGQEIKLCCKACRKDFDKDPAKYLAKLPKH